MSAYIRLNHFATAANQAFSFHGKKILCASADTLDVSYKDRAYGAAQRIENKNTWKIFNESLIATIGKQKFDWICNRYREHYQFSRLAASGAPLLPEHVEAFSAGSAQVFSRDLKALSPTREKLKDLSPAEIERRMQACQPLSFVGDYVDPQQIHGSPRKVSDYFFHNKKRMDQEKQILFSDVRRLSKQSALERFCKATVNRELIEGQMVPFPGENGGVEYRRLYRKIATGDGLVAYAFKRCGDSAPLLVFRPSQWAFSNEDAFETYRNDVQPNVGEMGWKKAAPLFTSLMNDPHFCPPDRRISIAGYSLGGAHAQRFLAEHYDKVNHAVFYASPSVERELAEGAAQRINQMPRREADPLNIQIFRARGDFCHYVGEMTVGCKVNHPDVNIQLLEIDHHNKKVSGFYLHSTRIFDTNSFDYRMYRYENPQDLYDHLDNSKRGPDVLWYERMRKIWGKAADYSFLGIQEIIKFFSKLFGVKVMRSSSDPQL